MKASRLRIRHTIAVLLAVATVGVSAYGGWQQVEMGSTADATTTTRTFGSVTAPPSNCSILREIPIENNKIRRILLCVRDSGLTYRTVDIVDAPITPTPTPSPTPYPWLSSCEVDTTSTLLNSGGVVRGTVNYGTGSSAAGGEGVGINYTGNDQYVQVIYSGNDRKWTNTTSVIVTVQNTENKLGRFTIGFSSTSSGTARYPFIIGPNETVTLSLATYNTPAEWTDFRWTGPIPQYQPDVNIVPVKREFYGVNVNSVESMFIIRDSDYADWSNGIRISDIHKDCRPFNNFERIMDQYGQLTYRVWPNKVSSNQDLLNDAAQSQSSAYPWGAVNAYQTPLSSPVVGSVTGKYHFQKISGVWRLIDPEGRQTAITGINGIDGNDAGGQLSDVDDIDNTSYSKFYTSLPRPTDPEGAAYRVIYSRFGYERLHYDAYQANLITKYGSDWVSDHNTTAQARLRTWGVNTCVACPAQVLTDETMRTIDWVAFSTGSFDKISGAYGIMPDVYDTDFATVAASKAATLVSKYNGHEPLNVGMYSDNEIGWGNKADGYTKWSVPVATLKLAGTAPAKIEFVNQLTTKYTTIGALNTAWGTAYGSWAALLADTHSTLTSAGAISVGMQVDFSAFLLDYARTYFQTVKDALDTAGYDGLYLGVRFRGNAYTDEVLQANAEIADAVSVNIYTNNFSVSNPEFKLLDKPVIISEFSMTTPAGNGKQSGAFETPTSKAAEDGVLQLIFDDLKSWHNVVGLQWWEYADESPTGRFADGENLGFGLVSITDRPYTDLVTTLTSHFNAMNTSW